MGSRLGAVRASRAWLGSAKMHRSLAAIGPWLTKTMGRVRTRAFVDVPKGPVVVGDRRRAPWVGACVRQWRVRAATVSPGSCFRKIRLRPSPEILKTIPNLCAAPCSMSTTLGNRSPHSGKWTSKSTLPLGGFSIANQRADDRGRKPQWRSARGSGVKNPARG